MSRANNTRTVGMRAAELDELLRTGRIGVLALADAEDAYAVPVAYDYDGESLLVRLAAATDSPKLRYLEATDTATLVVHDAGTPSWSVLARGPLGERGDFDEARINRQFSERRVFDEESDDAAVVVYELEMNEVTGRRTD